MRRNVGAAGLRRTYTNEHPYKYRRTIMSIRAIVIATAVVVVVAFIPAHAQSDWYRCVSPGVKLGYTFGEGGGFTWGLEFSFTFINDELSSKGFVLDLDYTPTFTKLHLGAQGSYRLVGADIGPTYLFDRTKKTHHYGLTATPFAGAILIPYASGTFLTDHSPIFEAGTYIKLPLPTEGMEFIYIN